MVDKVKFNDLEPWELIYGTCWGIEVWLDPGKNPSPMRFREATAEELASTEDQDADRWYAIEFTGEVRAIHENKTLIVTNMWLLAQSYDLAFMVDEFEEEIISHENQ